MSNELCVNRGVGLDPENDTRELILRHCKFLLYLLSYGS